MIKIFRRKRWLILLVTGVVGFSLQLIVFGYYGYGVIQVLTAIPITIFSIELLSLNIPKWINKSLDILGHNSISNNPNSQYYKALDYLYSK